MIRSSFSFEEDEFTAYMCIAFTVLIIRMYTSTPTPTAQGYWPLNSSVGTIF